MCEALSVEAMSNAPSIIQTAGADASDSQLERRRGPDVWHVQTQELQTDWHSWTGPGRRALAFCPAPQGCVGPGPTHSRGTLLLRPVWVPFIAARRQILQEEATRPLGQPGPLCQALCWALGTQRCQMPSWGISLRPEGVTCEPGWEQRLLSIRANCTFTVPDSVLRALLIYRLMKSSQSPP